MIHRTCHGTLTPLFFLTEKKQAQQSVPYFFMPQQPYSHPFLSYDELTRLLIQRGKRGDFSVIKRRLEDVGYQRLQAYWGTTDDGQIRTDFDTIWAQYCFDRQIRLMLLDAIERIEVAIRNRLVHYFCETSGAFGYLKLQK